MLNFCTVMNTKIFKLLSATAILILTVTTECSGLSSEGIKPEGYLYKKPHIPFELEPPQTYPPETCPVYCQEYPVPRGCPAVCKVNEDICNGRCLGKIRAKRDDRRVKCAWICKFNETTTTTTTRRPEFGCPDICRTNPYSYQCPQHCKPTTTTTTRRPLYANEEEEDIQSQGHAPPPKPSCSNACKANPYAYNCPPDCRRTTTTTTTTTRRPETCPLRCQEYPVPQGCPSVCRVNEDICNGKCFGKIRVARDDRRVHCPWICKYNDTTTTTTRRPETGCSTEICRTNPYSFQCPQACRPTTTRRPEIGCSSEICRRDPYSFQCPQACRPTTTTTTRRPLVASEEEEDIESQGHAPGPKQPSCSLACKANPYAYNCPPECKLTTTTPGPRCPDVCRTNPYSFSCPAQCRSTTTTTTTRRPEFGCPDICRTNPYSYQCPAQCKPATTTKRPPVFLNEEEEDILAAGQRPPPKQYQQQQEDAEHKIGDPYDFTYSVKDNEYGTDYTHQAQSKDDVVTGEYRVLMPDGRTQIVRYTADWKNGFRSHITYEGQISYKSNQPPPRRTQNEQN